MHEKNKYRHIPWNRYNLEKYRDTDFWSYRPALLACSFEREIEKAKGEQGSRKRHKFKKQFLFSFSEYKPHTHILQTASFVFFWKKRQTTDLGTNQSLYNSQESSVMLTGKKKIMNFDGEYISPWLEVGCWIFPALVSFPLVSPQGVIARLLRECVYSHFAPISMFTLWKRDAFSPGAKPTSCKLRIAAVRWTRSQRPPSTCVRGKIQPRVSSRQETLRN